MLEVTVYDEDRDRSADFLGKVAIPLLNVSQRYISLRAFLLLLLFFFFPSSAGDISDRGAERVKTCTGRYKKQRLFL